MGRVGGGGGHAMIFTLPKNRGDNFLKSIEGDEKGGGENIFDLVGVGT